MSGRGPTEIHVLGAAGTVTGSRYVLGQGRHRTLVECGLFQGGNELEDLNWESFPVEARDVSSVVLTHAHMDHAGYLPRFVADGFEGPVHASEATCALLGILLPDAARLQEEQARYSDKKRYSRHFPAHPLYTTEDADRALERLRPFKLGTPFTLDDGTEVTPRRAGHILGSATLDMALPDGPRVVFSGDLGRHGQDLMTDPAPVPEADLLFVESTYGDRDHGTTPVEDQIEAVVARTVREKGVLLVPSFAVGRAQHLLYYIRRLEDAGRIPRLPIFVDSPMATDATAIHCRFGDDLNLAEDLRMDDDRCPLRCPETTFVPSPEESKALNSRRGPFVVIAGNGMCSGGRIVHHLKARLPDARTTVLLVGYQATGSRGRRLQEGATSVRIHGVPVQVRARIETVSGLSAHGDRSDLLRWLSAFRRPPARTFMVHGEPAAASSLAALVHSRLGWATSVPRRGERIVAKAAVP